MVGTAIEHMSSIRKYSHNNERYENAFVLLYISLLNYVYIELFKLFDTKGKDAKENSVYTLISLIETPDNKYHKKLSKFNQDIESIKARRNHYFAHATGENPSEIFKRNEILQLEELLKTIVEICCDANEKLFPNTYVSNANDFDKWCCMAINSLNEVCELNDTLIANSISKEKYKENFDIFIKENKRN